MYVSIGRVLCRCHATRYIFAQLEEDPLHAGPGAIGDGQYRRDLNKYHRWSYIPTIAVVSDTSNTLQTIW